MHEKIIEDVIEGVREKYSGRGDRGLEDLLLLLPYLTNPQGLDPNLITGFVLGSALSSRGGRSQKFVKFAVVASLLSQTQSQASTSTSGVPSQPTSNLLPLIMLGLLGEEPEGPYPSGRWYEKAEVAEADVEEKIKKQRPA
jgi:hypothetical protein